MNFSDNLITKNGRVALVQTTSGSGTYIVPSGVKFIYLTMSAPGGGGAGCTDNIASNRGGGSGGGSGYSLRGVILKVTAGESFNWSVGNPGTGGTSGWSTEGDSGTVGEDTNFGTLITCTGGNPGVPFIRSGSPAIGGLPGELIINYDELDSSGSKLIYNGFSPNRIEQYNNGDSVEGIGGTGSSTFGTDVNAVNPPDYKFYYYDSDDHYIVGSNNLVVQSGAIADATLNTNAGGPGGTSLFGPGGSNEGEDGDDGVSYGSGGSGGGHEGSSASLGNGGNGGPGLLIIHEFYEDDPHILFSLTNGII